MIDIIMTIFILFLIVLLIVLMGWMAVDIFPRLNIFGGIKVKFTIKGFVDFIKAIYNMETRK